VDKCFSADLPTDRQRVDRLLSSGDNCIKIAEVTMTIWREYQKDNVMWLIQQLTQQTLLAERYKVA